MACGAWSRGLAAQAGHGHLGLRLAGITGRLVAEPVSERWPTLDLSALRPNRFGGLSGVLGR